MKIVHIATELSPIAKVGGLGDVVYGLSKELQRLEKDVEIIIPKYDCIDFSSVKGLKVQNKKISPTDCSIWHGKMNHLNIAFLESHHPTDPFKRGAIYGCPDDVYRFTYFCQAALDYLLHRKEPIDVLHLHDWPTALIPTLYKAIYRALGCRIGKIILTIHNLEHQGRCLPLQIHNGKELAKNQEILKNLQDINDPTLFNLFQSGILEADQITTVSPTYLREIQTPEGGFGLEKVLKEQNSKLRGILNGIDEAFWNPKTDGYLIKKYNTHSIDSAQQMKLARIGKETNRDHLTTHLHLEKSPKPLVACVTRLVPQKSPDLILKALYRTLEKGGQFVLLGSSPIPEIDEKFKRLQKEFKNCENVKILMDKDEALAHQIFAAADLFIIPSLFEPCGLTQMIALRYGTIPIARLTGGLADTVFDIDTSSKPLEERNGFTFEHPNEQGLYWALDRALHCFQNDPNRFEMLMQNGMRYDFTWKRTISEYLQIYAR